ncbi:Cell number regulator 1 [Bienertia sinuspersici]
MYASSKGRDEGLPYPAAPMSIATGQPSYASRYNGGSSAAGRGTVPWSTGLCHCCDDPANCLVTTFCPCITFGQIAELVNQGEPGCAVNGTIYALLMGFGGLACLYSCFYRPKLRGQYGLEELPCADCLVHFCCEPCALCQEFRELKNRGFDMGIGWEANIKRQKAGITVAPPVGVMMR